MSNTSSPTIVTEYSPTALEVLRHARMKVELAQQELQAAEEHLVHQVKEAYDGLGIPQSVIAETIGTSRFRVSEMVND